MTRSQRWTGRLHAYHDGELSRIGRWRVERRLARDPVARRELEGLRECAVVLREVDAEMATPDLWAGVEMRLHAVDASRREASSREPALWERLGATPRLVGGALAGVAAALALLVGSNLAVGPAEPGAVRWLDSRGSPVMVLQDDREATIIWLFEATEGETLSGRSGRVLI